jgi:chemotaxis protein CheZ
MAHADTPNAQLRERYGSMVVALQAAIDAGDDTAFRAAFDGLREGLAAEFMPELKRLTASAESALARFRERARIDALADQEVPDARKRLAHVVQLTDEAAHRTLDLVERSGPLIEQTAKDAAELLEAWKVHGTRTLATASLWPERALGFLERSLEDSDRVRSLLTEMLMAQGYQDITGQIIRSVISLVGEIEEVLGQLVALSNGEETRRMPALKLSSDKGSDKGAANAAWQQGLGPQVPGITDQNAVSDQDDIDALIASMAGGPG